MRTQIKRYFARAAVLLIAIMLAALIIPVNARADTLDELEQEVSDGLDKIDFSEVENVSQPFFPDFVEKIKQIINGEFDSAESVWQMFASLFGSSISAIFPQLAAVFCVMIICGLTRRTSEGFISPDTENVISFVGIAVVLVSVMSLIAEAYLQVNTMLSQVSALTDASMPILLTLVIANGGSASSSVCQPSMVMFSSAVITVVKNIILPLSVFGLAFVIVSNIFGNVRVNKMAGFLSGAASWALGIVFMLFSAFTAVQGISAAAVDGISYRAAKFAAKNYIPILGGYISEGFDIIVASTSLIKNAFGAVAMLLVFFMAVKPLVTLLCVNLGLQAVAALAEPVVEEKYVKMISGIGKNLTFLSALVIAVAFMFCILSLVAISCANGA